MFPTTAVSIFAANGSGTIQVVNYSFGITNTLSLTGNQLATLTDDLAHNGTRVALGGPGAPDSLLGGVLECALSQSAEASACGFSTYFADGGHAADAGVVLATEVDAVRYAYVADTSGSGFSVFRVEPDDSLTQIGTLEDTSTTYGGQIAAMARVTTSQGQLLFTGSSTEHGLNVYQIGANGLPVLVNSVGVEQLLPVQTISTLATANVAGTQFLLVSASGSSSITVLEVANDGTLTPRDHVLDTLDTRFQNITQLEVFEVGGHSFVLAAGADDGISLLALMPDGYLIHLETLSDSVDLAISGISDIEVRVIADTVQVFVTSGTEAGLTQLHLDMSNLGNIQVASSGTLMGTSGSDTLALQGAGTLQGGGNDDILRDGNGANTLIGGTGQDIFVLVADGEVDTIADFEVGQDRIDLSFIPQLYNMSQISITYTSDGAILQFADEILHIYTANGNPLTPADLASNLLPGINRTIVTLGSPVISDDPLSLTGTGSADTLQGDSLDDTLSGLAGDDLLTGGEGNDLIDGGSGNDTVVIDATRASATVTNLGGGSVRIVTADGTDTIHDVENFTFTDGTVTLAVLLGTAGPTATSGDDTLVGSSGPETIDGLAGNDSITGLGGADSLLGNIGNDTLLGSTGNDTLIGGGGADRLLGGSDDDRLLGGNGADFLFGSFGHDTLFGGTGNDVLRGNGGNDTINGEIGNDTLIGGNGYDRLDGGDGNDRLDGGTSADNLYGRDGDDTLLGGGGQDRLFGGLGNDSAEGGNGHDRFWGSNGNDTFSGGAGDDRAYGENGNDSLRGGGDNDTLSGGGGYDTLNGGVGNDSMTGGANADVFIFADGHGDDTITDFNATNNLEDIDLSAVAAIGNITQLLSAASQVGGNVLIDTGGGNSITLLGVNLGDLDANDFIF